jgi:hypothetical protein
MISQACKVTEPASCKSKSKFTEMLFKGINQSRYLTEYSNFTDLNTSPQEYTCCKEGGTYILPSL